MARRLRNRNRIKLVASAGAALAVAGGGAALAAGELTPRQERAAIIDDAAEQLGVESSELEDALEQALENRVDEAVADGRLTKEQGEELKARIAAGEAPLLGLRGGGPGFGHHERAFGFGAGLDAAAGFLGLTGAELRAQLRDGKSLAEIAKAEAKTVGALVDALVAAAKTELAEAVESGRLTDAQRDRLLEELEERIAEGVNATPGRHFRGGPGEPSFRGGPHVFPPAGESGYRFGGGTEPPAAA